MLWWLVDNATTVYFLLGLAALGLFALWWMNRRGKYLLALAVPLALIALTWLLTLFVVTDNRRLEQICQEIAHGIRKHNLDQVFKHISSSFNQANHRQMNKEELRNLAKSHMDRVGAEDVQFSKFSVGEVAREKKMAQVEFWVCGVEDLKGAPIRCETTFVWEGDAWRMKGFKLFIANTGNQYPFP
jgi:hypothetical protein